MKIAALLMIAVILVFGGIVAFRLWNQGNALSADFSAAQNKLDKAQSANQTLTSELEYLSHPENIEKELRARFNLHLPGEHTVIVVPQPGAAAAP